MTLIKTLEEYKSKTFSEPLEAEKWIYRQALRDVMERVKNSALYRSKDHNGRIDLVKLLDLENIMEDLRRGRPPSQK